MKIFTERTRCKGSALLLLCLTALQGWAQTTVFNDDFGSNTSATYVTSGAINTSAVSASVSGTDWGVRRATSGMLELTNDISGTTNSLGWAYAYTSLSGFSSPFNSTLSSNTDTVTWTFNFRTNRSSALAGFTATSSYGMAFILACNTTTPNTSGSGYAVVMGGGSSNNIGLIAFNNGLQGTRTTVVSFGNTPTNLTDYISVRVKYTPSSNTWALASRDDGASAFSDPAAGTLTSIGSATNSTYTGTSMTTSGFYWQGSTAATQTATCDNLKVTVYGTPVITLDHSSFAQVSAGNVNQNSTGNILSRFRANVATASATLNQISFAAGGNFTAGDISNFKLYTSTGTTFPGGSPLSTVSAAAIANGGTVTFSSLSQSCAVGDRYFWITADISSTATMANTVSVPALSNSAFTFASGTPTNNITAGGTQTIQAGNSAASDIIAASFTAPTDIDYRQYQTTNITAASGDIEVARFSLRDGGATTDADAEGTTLTDLSFSLGNSSNIRRVALYDGSTELAEQAGAATVTFSGLSLTAADGSSKTFSVWVSFNSTVTDNQQFQFTVSSATASVSGSGFAAANAGAAVSSVSGTDNKLIVTATQLAFVQQPSNTNLNASMTPAVTVSANDANGSRDLDFALQVRITSSGTLTGTPIDVTASSGLATFSSLTHTVQGTGLTLTAQRTATTDWNAGSNTFDIAYATQSSDYFRSNATTGNWNANGSWESSSDNSNWFTATATPTSAANAITIRNGNNISVTASVTIDQVTVQSGGTLSYTGGTLTVNDGSGDDITVQSGGIMVYSTASTYPSFGSGSPAIRIQTGGMLRVSNTGIASNVQGSNYTYEDASVFEYTSSSAFSASGVTYFPNAGASVIPIFRVTNTLSSVGGGSATVVNGVFEVASGGSITWSGTGTKTMRNGIRGAGNMSQGTAGQLLITGTTADLGGAGTLTLGSNGLQISSSSVTTMSSDKTINSGTMTVAGTLDAGTYQVLTSSSGAVTINGTFRSANANGFSGGTNTSVHSGVTLNALGSSSTIDYYFHGSMAVSARSDYANITFSAAGTKTLSSAATASGVITLTSGTFATGGNLTLGSTGSIVHNGGSITGFTMPSQVANYTPPSGSTTLTGNLTVTGTLALGDNTLDIAGNTLNINGDLTTGTSGVIKSNGTGSVNIGGTGTMTGNLKFDQTTPGTTNRIANLTMNRTSSGAATLGNALEVTGTLTLSNGTLTTGGNLTLVSDASGTARIATIPGTADISGNVTAQRFVAAGSVATRRYRMFSSPNQNFTFAQLSDDIFITGSGGASNGFDATGNNNPSCYTYQESPTGGRGWKPVTNTSNSLSAGVGALVFVRGDRTLASPDWYTPGSYPAQNAVTIDYTNQPVNKGNVSPTLTYNSTGDAAADGWNLVGNPYPSQIDWTALTKSNLGTDYYIYNPATGSYQSNNGSAYIASGQGFFVQATATSPSITFTEASKVSNAPTGYFKSATQQIGINMSLDAYNSDIAWLEFESGAAKGFSAGEDAVKFPNALINFGFYMSPTMTVQRNRAPYPGAADTFALTASAPAGSYTLTFANIAGTLSSRKNIYLKDLFTNSLTDLRSTTAYTFTITSNPASSGVRFLLVINDPSLLPVEWLSFTGERSGKSDAALAWQTANEKNTSHFVIERSYDAKIFTDAASVSASGNSAIAREYAFTDHDVLKPGTAVVYYRIRQVDEDGRSSHSHAVSVHGAEEKVIGVFPNPATDKLYLQAEGAVSFEVLDGSGRLLRAGVLAPGGSIDVSTLKPGMYLLKATEAATGRTMSAKFGKD